MRAAEINGKYLSLEELVAQQARFLRKVAGAQDIAFRIGRPRLRDVGLDLVHHRLLVHRWRPVDALKVFFGSLQ